MSTENRIGRLAMRVEGDNWVAYYALPNTLEGALFLGSIAMGIVINNPGRKSAFMTMMRDAVADIIQEHHGKRPSWEGPVPAPEHEKSGKA